MGLVSNTGPLISLARIGRLDLLPAALAVLRREVEPQNNSLFSLMAEGPVDQIQGIRRDIEEYVGIADLVAGEKA